MAVISSFPFNGVRLVRTAHDESVSRYAIHADGLATVHVTVDWSQFAPELKTSDILDHAVDRALRASKQWRQWSEVYCGSA